MPPPSVPLDAIPLPALLYGADGRIAAANDLAEAVAGRKLAGCSAADVVRVFRHRHADGSPLAPGDLPACRALAGDEVATVPLSITAADGRTVDMVATASPVRDGDTIAGALVVLQDVTRRVRAEEALAESEARYRALFETMNEGFMVVEPIFDEHGTPASFRHLEVNPAKARLSGRTREELVGRDARETAPGVEDCFVETYARVAATGEPAHLEAHARGLGRWLSVDVYSPEPGRAAVVVSDITARKEAEERQAFLLALGDRLRELDDVAAIAAEAAERVGRHLGASGAVYCEIDEAGEYATVRADWNDGTVPPAIGRFCMDDFGIGDLYRRGEVRRTTDVAAEYGRNEAEKHRALEIRASLGVPVLRSGKLAAVLAVHSARPRAWTDAEVELVREAGGRIWSAVERARARAALRASEAELAVAAAVAAERQRLFEVFEALPVGTCLLTREHGIAFANRRFRETFGASAGRLCHESCFDLPEPCPFCESFRVLETGEPHRWEVALPNGRIVEATDLPFVDADGTTMVLEIDRDITEERRLEAALREANARLEERVEERTAELAEANARLQAILDALPVGVLVADADGTMVVTNSAAGAIWGTTPLARRIEEYSGYKAWRPGTGERIAVVDSPLARSLRGESVTEMVMDFERFDGTRGTQIASSTPIRDAAGAVTGGVAIALDITALREAERALAESEKRYQTIVETASEGIVIGRPDGPHTYANRRMGELLGYPPGELVGRSSLDLTFDEWRPEVGRVLEDLGRGEVLQGEFKFRHRDGSAVWTLYSASPIVNEHGEHVANLALYTDITERKRLEEELRRAYEQATAVLESISDSFLALDRDWRFTFINRRALDYSEKTPADVIGRSIWEVFPEILGTPLEAFYRTAMDSRDSLTYENPSNVATGKIFELRTYPTDVGLSIFGKDITLRRRAEEALRESEERLRMAQESAAIGVWDWDIRTGTQTYTPELLRLYDQDGETLDTYEQWRASIHPDDIERVEAERDAAIAARETIDLEYRVILPSGETRWLAAVGRGYYDDEGAPVRILGVNIDITERKKAETELARYAGELQRSNEELQRFAYVASHDLQEPLRSIVSFSQLLERRYQGRLGQDADEYIAFIVDGGNRMQALIRDLLAFSRIETMAGEPVPVDAGRAVLDALVTFNGLIQEIGATVTVGPLPTVRADPRQLEQVFANLVGNAIKYRRPEVPLEVRIGAIRTNGVWEFSVADNGIGIEEEYFDRIFEMFRRLHTHDKYEGTGIGLAVVKRIVERSGGSIRVESTPGEGSTFVFTLPAA